ncbi:hypothetical protein FRX31_012979 [Thalictrum thalictroides]|uniref:Uncharacterized protein n=1 Tax=Thalictrum thalictroides TaxID=46969 RepID=A0A7J6WKH3_THATH|nr:hypothetical protein FRX31_012979 [Thalictrum thalictroides]
MPLLVLDQNTVLSDLPVTLPSLFSDSNWMVIVEPTVMNFWKSTERIFNWAKLLESSSYSASNQYSIDESESNDAVFLVQHFSGREIQLTIERRENQRSYFGSAELFNAAPGVELGVCEHFYKSEIAVTNLKKLGKIND